MELSPEQNTEIPLLPNTRKLDENLDVRFEQIGVVCLSPVVILFLFVECANDMPFPTDIMSYSYKT